MPQGERVRVLLVDDHFDCLITLSALLDTMGYQVTSTDDPRQAADIAARFLPDIVLLDIGMPRLDGYQLAALLRANPRFARVPLVAITGYGTAADKERARQAGFTAHLTKPTEPGDLEATMTRILAA